MAVQYTLELRARRAEKAIVWRTFLSAAVAETDEEISELYFHSLQLLESEFLN